MASAACSPFRRADADKVRFRALLVVVVALVSTVDGIAFAVGANGDQQNLVRAKIHVAYPANEAGDGDHESANLWRQNSATIGADGAADFSGLVGDATSSPASDDSKPQPPAALLEDSVVTTEDAKLPPWAMMLIGSVASAILVVVTMQIIACFTSPLPWGLKERENIEDALRTANEQAEELRHRLEGHHALAAAAALAAENPEVAPPADQGTTQRAVDRLEPLLARADHAVATFQDGIKTAQKNVEEVAHREATDMVEKMQSVLRQEEHAVPEWLRGQETDPPPIALLVAGLFSPALMRWTQSQARAQITVNIVFLGGALGVYFLDKGRKCDDPKVWIWFTGFLAINFLELFCRWLVISRANAARAELVEQEERRQAESTGNTVWDAYNALQNNAGQFFMAMHKYNLIVGGWSFMLLRLMGGVSIAWGGFSLWVSIADVLEDETHCDAQVVVSLLHLYSFYFTVFLVVKVGALVLWFVSLLTGCPCVTGTMLKVAKGVDDEMPSKLPVMMTFVRAFWLQTKSDGFEGRSLYLRQQIYNMEKEREKLVKQAREYEARIDKNTEEAEKMDARQRPEETGGDFDEDKFVEVYENRMREALDAATPVVALLGAAAGKAAAAGPIAIAEAQAFAAEAQPFGEAQASASGVKGSKGTGKGRADRQSRGSEAIDF